MKNEKAQKIIKELITEAGNESVDVAKVSTKIDALREIARELQDPLVLKTLRFVKEKLAEGNGFELDLENDEEEEFEVPENQLQYLFQLLLDSENKYNREEIKIFRTALQEELY